MALNFDPTNVVYAQALELPDLSGLPPFVQGIFYTVGAVAFGLTIIIPRMGWAKGQAKPATGANPAVAAVVVDLGDEVGGRDVQRNASRKR